MVKANHATVRATAEHSYWTVMVDIMAVDIPQVPLSIVMADNSCGHPITTYVLVIQDYFAKWADATLSGQAVSQCSLTFLHV